MDRIIIITADLGHFKAYRVTEDPPDISPRVTLIESYDSVEGHGKLGDKLSDAGGRFRRSAGKDEVAKGSGERHNIELGKGKETLKNNSKRHRCFISQQYLVSHPVNEIYSKQ